MVPGTSVVPGASFPKACKISHHTLLLLYFPALFWAGEQEVHVPLGRPTATSGGNSQITRPRSGLRQFRCVHQGIMVVHTPPSRRVPERGIVGPSSCRRHQQCVRCVSPGFIDLPRSRETYLELGFRIIFCHSRPKPWVPHFACFTPGSCSSLPSSNAALP